MVLDRDTILALSALISLVLGLILLVVHSTGRLGRWAASWGGGNLALGLAGADQAMRGILPDAWLVSGSNVIAIAGYALIVQGARLLAGRKPRWTTLVIVVVAVTLPLALSHLPAQKPFRVAYNNSILIVCDLWVAMEAVLLARKERLSTPWIMVGLFGITVPFSAARLHVALLTILGGDTINHAKVGTWLAALLAAFWSIRGVLPTLVVAERMGRNLARLAYHDGLTGAFNRVGLDRVRDRLDGPAAVAMMDLDHFKTLNDRYGHAQGDAVLRSLTSAAATHQREGDLFVRLGGDEFLLILPGADADQAVIMVERIRRDFAAAIRPLLIAAPSPTVSVGIAAGDLGGDGLRALMSEADDALYQSKRLGRDRVSQCRDDGPGGALAPAPTSLAL